MTIEGLYNLTPPWVILEPEHPDDTHWIPEKLHGRPGTNSVIRVLRGAKIRTRQEMMNEFGAALQFFEGFGENWHALKERLSYLDEWLPGDAYVLVVTEAHLVLDREPSDQLHWLLQTFNEVGEWWSEPITDNGRFNRGPIPYDKAAVEQDNSFDPT